MKPLLNLFEGIFANQSYDREGYGSTPNPTDPTPIGLYPKQQHNINTFNAPIEFGNCNSLRDWQQDIVNKLQNNNNDIYLMSLPGSGKTTPLLCYWINRILGINTNETTLTPQTLENLARLVKWPEQIPKILWLVPIKNLGVNIEQDIYNHFISMILQLLNKACIITPDGSIIFNNSNFNIHMILNFLSKYGNEIDSELYIQPIGQPILPDPNAPPDPDKLQLPQFPSNTLTVKPNKVNDFKEAVGNLVRNFVKNGLIGRKEAGIDTFSDHHHKPFIIAIYESAKSIINDMENLRLIVFDEGQRIQGGTDADDKRAAQIGDSIHRVLINSHSENAKLIILSGSSNPITARNVTHFFNVAYGRHFPETNNPHQTPSTASNPSHVTVSGVTGLQDSYNQKSIIKGHVANSKNKGMVFVILGKNRINSLIDSMFPNERGTITPQEKLSYKKEEPLFNHKKDSKHLSKTGSINDIIDERLRRAASNGVGFLYRKEENLIAMQHDTAIIQDLFQRRIINVILATDSIREGITIDCDIMYIPSILDPTTRKEAELGSLTQLVNRTGRRENIHADIITSPEFVGTVTKAFTGNSSNFKIEPFVMPSSRISKLSAETKYLYGLGKSMLEFFS